MGRQHKCSALRVTFACLVRLANRADLLMRATHSILVLSTAPARRHLRVEETAQLAQQDYHFQGTLAAMPGLFEEEMVPQAAVLAFAHGAAATCTSFTPTGCWFTRRSPEVRIPGITSTLSSRRGVSE